MQKFVLFLMLPLLALGVAVGQEPVESAGLKEPRQERLSAYTKSLVDWSVATADFTPDQESALADLLDKQVEQLQRHWLQNPRGTKNDIRLTYFASDPMGAARRLPLVHKAPGLIAALTTANTERLDVLVAAVRERAMYHEELAADSYTGVLTKIANLSPKEQTVLRRLLKTRYRLRVLNGAPTRSNLKNLKLLDDVQLEELIGNRMDSLSFHIDEKIRLQDFRAKIEVPPTENELSPDELRQHVSTAIRQSCHKFEDRYEISMRGRIRDIAARNGLTEKQVRRLELAATGIRKRKMQTWIEEARTAVRPTEQIVAWLNQGSVWRIEVRFTPIKLSQEKLWLTALIKLEEKKDAPTSPAVRNGLVSQTMQWLDQELWLRPKQRKPIRKLVDQAVTDLHTDESIDQLRLVFRSAVKNMKSAEVEKLLTTQQRSAWQRIRKPDAVVAVRLSE